MNLHAIASQFVAAVNPMVTAQWRRSTGSSKNADYSRTPGYADPVDVQCQVQPMTWKDLQQISGLNVTGEKKAIYVEGNVQGVLRADNKGGDLFTLPDATMWLCVQVLENFSMTSGWTKIGCVRQLD